MALNKQIIPLALGQPIDTSTDVKQMLMGSLRRAENVVFETLLSAKKRKGYSSILLKKEDNTRISGVQAASKFKDELLLFGNANLYSFSETLQTVQPKGTHYSFFPTTKTILSNSYDHDSADATYVQGLNVYVCHNASLGDVRYTVQDVATGSLLVNNAQVDSVGSNIRVATLSGDIYLVYTSGTSLKVKKCSSSQPGTLSTATTVATNVNSSNPRLDAITVGTQVIVAFNSTAAGANVQVFPISSNGVIGSVLGLTGSNASTALELFSDSSERIIVTFSDNTTSKYAVLPYTMVAPLLGVTVLDATANIKAFSMYEYAPGTIGVYYEVAAAASVNTQIKHVTATISGTVSSSTTFMRSVGLASKTFQYDNSNYLAVAFETNLQPTYFIVDSSARIFGKINAELAGGHVTTGSMPKVSSISDSEFLFPGLIKTRTITDSGSFYALKGMSGSTLDFAFDSSFSTAQLGDNLHVAGGVLQSYDGSALVEHGFHVWPETLAAGSSASTGGFMSDGDYSYIAVYSWTDNAGQQHRSVPSLPLNVVLSGGTSTQTQQVIIPTLRLTSKTGVSIELYRTEDAGSIYYKVTSSTSPAFNNPAVDTITFTDTLADSTIISREPLYTTGGVLENTAAPALKRLAVHTAANRLVGVGERANTLIFSKIWSDGYPVEFNDTLYKSVDPVGGPITAMASMDEKLIIFEEDALFFMSGAGPNNLGQQDTYTEPERLSAEIGCIEPRSVVLTPDGLMFKSRKGIYLLTRGLQLGYIGNPVEQYNSLNITSAKVLGSVNQVRFTTSDGQALVYNYFLKRWSTDSNHEALGAETIRNNYYYIRSDSELFMRSESSYADNGSPVKMLLETGWLSFNQLQGFQRVYKILLLGDYKSEHKLRVQFAYDFNDAFVQEAIITPEDFVSVQAYGDESPYGAGLPYGGSGAAYQARIDLTRQKCQAIKIRIEDVQATAGEGLALSAISLQVGAKASTGKFGKAAKFGTT